DFTVIIPEEAIDDWMVLSVGVPEDPPDYAAPSPDFRQIGYTYEAGSTISDFLSGVTVQFVYNDTDLGDLEEAELLIWKYDSLDVVLGEVEQIQIDTTENVISGLTASLAYFVLGG
ncbi:hypothetical protein KKA08_06965, partial [bacterium]|nr:hypothetical protein [bacterium]